jgi:hypothetical protein
MEKNSMMKPSPAPLNVPSGVTLSAVTGTVINKNTMLAEPTLQQAELYQLARSRVTEVAPGIVENAQQYLEQIGEATGEVAQEVASKAAKDATNKALIGGAVVVGVLFLLLR